MILPTIIAIVSALLVGYLWGKHDRIVCENKEWIVRLPLLLRQKSLEKGYCILCNEPKKKRMIYKLSKQHEKRN
jgi:hypothetical protein